MEETTNQQVTSQPQPEMHSSSGMPRMVIIAGVVVLMALIGLGGYVLGTRNTAKVQEASQQQVVSVSPTATTAQSPTMEAQVSPTTGTAMVMKTYSNTEVPFSIQYPSIWQQKEQIDTQGTQKPYAVNLTGNEGNVYIVWGTGFGGAYCAPSQNPQTYSIPSQGLTGCSTMNADGTESWFLFKEISNTLSIKIQAQAKAPYSANAAMITQILSSFKFQ